MIRAVSTGRDTLIGIERLRLQTAVDLYRTWAMVVQAALGCIDDEHSELCLHLSHMQRAFRGALQTKAAELANACSGVVKTEKRTGRPSEGTANGG
ncbi:MAG TPA: hypothetical protein VHG92_07325 [Afifellaceae bacterium]|nr:hypothetical protein [Afifellaceae bacterium]